MPQTSTPEHNPRRSEEGRRNSTRRRAEWTGRDCFSGIKSHARFSAWLSLALLPCILQVDPCSLSPRAT
eukprot:2384150-Rhodomonas_salina.2